MKLVRIVLAAHVLELAVLACAQQVSAQHAEVFLDKPLDPPLQLVLEDARQPGKTLDVSTLKGRIVVLRSAVPECGHWHGDRDGIAPYRKLYKEYHDRAVFIAVRTDFLHDTNKPFGQRLQEAAQYCRVDSLPGAYLVDNNEKDFIRLAGGTGGWAFLVILDREGKIVCRHGHSPAFQYYDARMVLDRLLDPAFDRAYREGFPDKPATLPRVERRKEGTAYLDDFESYQDSYDFQLQPRWGFRRRNALTGGLVEAGAGRGGSQAAMLLDGLFLSRKLPNIEHVFPQPLRHGHLRWYIRRGPAGWDTKNPRTVFRATVYAADGAVAGTLDVQGAWRQEAFSIDGKATTWKLSAADWHEIRIEVRPDRPAQVLIDDHAAGELAAGALARVGFNCGHHGACLDDFELYHAE